MRGTLPSEWKTRAYATMSFAVVTKARSVTVR